MNKEEQNIIRECLRNNRSAQQKLYVLNKVFLFGVAMRYSNTKHEAEDILQEGFYRVLKDLRQYSGTSSFKAWMKKVMVNSALMHIRKHHKLKVSELTINVINDNGPQDYTLFDSDRAQAIISLIRQLPKIQQTVFNLRGMDGYSFKEISETLDIKESTLRSHYLRARNTLQLLLQKELI